MHQLWTFLNNSLFLEYCCWLYSALDSSFDFWRLINSLTYLFTYLQVLLIIYYYCIIPLSVLSQQIYSVKPNYKLAYHSHVRWLDSQ